MPHSAKCVNTSTRSPAANTASTISSRRASLPERPASGRSSSWYAGGMVADLLERGDRGEDLALARLLALGQTPVPVTSVSSSAWYRPICSGVIAQWSSSSIWSGSSAAIDRLGLRAPEHEDAVERAHRVFGLDARRAAVARERRDELRPRADETGVREVEDRPEVAETVLDRRTGERDAVRAGMRRSCCDVSLAGFLIACASSRIDLRPRHLRDRVDVAHRGAVGGDDDVGVGDLGRDLVGGGAVRAVVHDDAQIRA